MTSIKVQVESQPGGGWDVWAEYTVERARHTHIVGDLDWADERAFAEWLLRHCGQVIVMALMNGAIGPQITVYLPSGSRPPCSWIPFSMAVWSHEPLLLCREMLVTNLPGLSFQAFKRSDS